MTLRRSLLSAAPLAGLLSLLACQPPPQSPGPNATKSGEAAGAGAATAEVDPASCTTLSTKLCDRAGAESSICTSAKKTATLLSAKSCAVALADIEYSYEQIAAAGKSCTELSEKLCKDLGADTQTCEMVTKETPKMAAEQCDAMLAQYDTVLADLERMEAKNKPLPADKVAKLTAGEPPAFGPADATVTVVEFSDFQCPYCSLAANAVNELKPKYGDRVRFVFRQFPLSFHPDAHLAAQASLAANAQGKFWEFHDKVFANQKAMSRADLEKYAEELGLDMAAFKQALDQGTYKQAVDDELKLGEEVYVEGTPTMFINGQRVANATDATAIGQALDKALAGGGAAPAEPTPAAPAPAAG